VSALVSAPIPSAFGGGSLAIGALVYWSFAVRWKATAREP
jgi:hypothetical protein